jgi:hypothetical protein
VDVDEGVLTDDFDGRHWKVKVQPAGDARHDEALKRDDQKKQKHERQQRDDEAKLLSTLDRLDPDRQGCGTERLGATAGLNWRAVRGAVARLVAEGLLVEWPVKVTAGNGATRLANGVRRAAREVGDGTSPHHHPHARGDVC